MKPILLIHGYSSEGKNTPVKDIYGSLPEELKKRFRDSNVLDLNLSRWISLNDGITLDDVSLAMNRALNARFPKLLSTGFNVIIHSTGALVVRNWIKNHSPKPCPIGNFVHLAGANFGSGLAHIGMGQLARWGRLIFLHTGSGRQVLNELEFGSWKTLDLHRHFLQANNDMFDDYHVQEFCIIGSQIPKKLRVVPIRYVKEDSSDNTVRTSAGNLNFNYVSVTPKPNAFTLTTAAIEALVEKRLNDESIEEKIYDFDLSQLSDARQEVPFAIAYETAHFGKDIGIVLGSKNRNNVMPLIKTALETPYDGDAYKQTAERFKAETAKTFQRVSKLKSTLFEWNKQAQYEGHAQLIFRVRDQFGTGVEHFDITLKSKGPDKSKVRLESLIEDHHGNKKNKGTITYYLRTQKFDKKSKKWRDQIAKLLPLDVEITGHEPLSDDISYVPLNIRLTVKQVASIVLSFQTTIIDVQLVRLPSRKVFDIKSN